MARSHSLFPRGRRYLAAVLALMLLAPAGGLLLGPRQDRSVLEHRFLAAPPAAPHDLKGWLAFPAAVDAYVRDHFAGREQLIFVDLWLSARSRLKPAAAAGAAVIRGNGGWLLLESGLEGATGGHTDPGAANRYADFVCALAGDMRTRRIPFLFAPVPGSAEIYPEAVPDWVPKGPVSQPRRVLDAARACAAPVLDLSPALLAAKVQGQVYQRQDSHWTNIGALAAYNAVAERLGRPGWTIAPQAMHWTLKPATGSDLVRLSGLVDLPRERLPEPPEGPDSRPQTNAVPGLAHGEHPPPFLLPGTGPIVLIIGDSYTSDFMSQYARRAGLRLAWTHHAQCRFDRRIFDLIRPDVVVLAPVDRLESCR